MGKTKTYIETVEDGDYDTTPVKSASENNKASLAHTVSKDGVTIKLAFGGDVFIPRSALSSIHNQVELLAMAGKKPVDRDFVWRGVPMEAAEVAAREEERAMERGR